jgi:hypothetical protein
MAVSPSGILSALAALVFSMLAASPGANNRVGFHNGQLTGVNAKISLEWTPGLGHMRFQTPAEDPGSAPPPPPDSSRPSIFVDHAERPVDN